MGCRLTHCGRCGRGFDFFPGQIQKRTNFTIVPGRNRRHILRGDRYAESPSGCGGVHAGRRQRAAARPTGTNPRHLLNSLPHEYASIPANQPPPVRRPDDGLDHP